MPATTPCAPCCSTPTTTNVPGSAGAAGFTSTTANFVIPAADANVTIAVLDTSWMSDGLNLYIGGANFKVNVGGVLGPTSVSVKFLNFDGDTAAGSTIVSGSLVRGSVGGLDLPLSIANGGTSAATRLAAITALINNQLAGVNALTDNSTGAAGDTIAAGAGVYILVFHIQAATIANGDLLTNYVPGHKFKILKFDARCAKAVTTGAKASTLNLEINTTDLIGGVVALSGTYALGAAQAGSTVTANNTGSATDSFSIEASGTTAFTEGEFWLIIAVQNMDSADAIASMASKINSIRTALTA